jgi:dihydrofolate reductase
MAGRLGGRIFGDLASELPARSTGPGHRCQPASGGVVARVVFFDEAEHLGVEGVERHDELHVIGSLNLVQSLLRFGLIARLKLWLYPVLLGNGNKVFGDGTVPTALRLIESVTYSNGMLQLTYETAVAPTYGNI